MPWPAAPGGCEPWAWTLRRCAATAPWRSRLPRRQGRLTGLIAAGISLEPHGRDRYRRLLAIVRDQQGRNVAQILTRNGLRGPTTAAGGERGGVGERRRSRRPGMQPLA